MIALLYSPLFARQIRENNSNHGYTIIARLTLLRKERIIIAIMVIQLLHVYYPLLYPFLENKG